MIQAVVTPRILKYMWPEIFLNKVMYSYMMWPRIFYARYVVQAGTFHTEYVNLITIIYAPILFFSISSAVRCLKMKMSKKKKSWPKV